MATRTVLSPFSLLVPSTFALLAFACSSPPPSTAATAAPAASSAAPAESAAPAADAGAAQATAKPAPSEEPSGSPREKLMRSHFKEAAQLRSAVIRGALPETIAPAEALAKMEGLGTVQKSWQPSLDALQAASKRVGHSPDIPGAAAATADIGMACGSCHRASTGPKVTVDAPPAAGDSLTSRMQRHVWANERLWEALYVPSDASWKAGVDALAADPFPKEVLDKGGVHARSAASRFKSLVATAGDKKKPEDRAKLYASLLETCASCHLATKGGGAK